MKNKVDDKTEFGQTKVDPDGAGWDVGTRERGCQPAQDKVQDLAG
jgi:hypothetical protein